MIRHGCFERRKNGAITSAGIERFRRRYIQFSRNWEANNDDKRHLIAQIVLRTFAEVYEIPENQLLSIELCLE